MPEHFSPAASLRPDQERPDQEACLWPVDDVGTEVFERISAGLRLYVLLDAACSARSLPMLFHLEQSRPHESVFANTELKKSDKFSPWLTETDTHSELFLWITEQAPKGWGMLLCAGHEPAVILRHLRSLLFVSTPKTEKAIFRFWDGRVLGRIAKGMPGEVPALLGPVAQALFRDEDGNWAAVENPAEYAAAAYAERYAQGKPWYAFTREHLDLFADKKLRILSFNIAESLHGGNPEDTRNIPESETISSFVRKHVQRGYDLGLRSDEGLTNFLYCCLRRGAGFPQGTSLEKAFPPVTDENTLNRMLHTAWTREGGFHA